MTQIQHMIQYNQVSQMDTAKTTNCYFRGNKTRDIDSKTAWRCEGPRSMGPDVKIVYRSTLSETCSLKGSVEHPLQGLSYYSECSCC